MADIDGRIAHVAAAQDGVLTRAQFCAAGGTEKMLRTRIADGRLVAVAPSVYRIGGASETWRSQLRAGLLTFGPMAAVSHTAAASLLHFDTFEEGPLEFTVPMTRRRTAAFGVLHTSRQCEPVDFIVTDDDLRCTSATRTIIDLASTRISDERLEKAIDSAVRFGSTAPAFLRRRLTALRGPGAAGARRLDALLLDSGGHSPLEREFLRRIRLAGLPRPSTQVVHRRNGATFARVDFQFDPLPLVVEVSGRLGHSSDLDRQKDARRRNQLQADGCTVLEFVTLDVWADDSRMIDAISTELRRLLQRSVREIRP